MSLFKRSNRKPAAGVEKAGAPVFEALETRDLLTGMIEGNTLFITGNDGDNVITVKPKGKSGDQVSLGFKGAFKAKFTFDAADFDDINVNVFGGNDMVWIDPRIMQGAFMQGGAGDDTLKGGAGDDSLDGGEGNDTLHQAPNDILINNGPDDAVVNEPGVTFVMGKLTILGGDGKDKIRVRSLGNGIVSWVINNTIVGQQDGVTALCIEGRGDDDKIDLDGSFPDAMGNPLPVTVLGGAGNDKIDAEDARNVSMDGGEGNDKLSVASNGTAGMGNHATLTGGAGTDQFKAGMNDSITDAQPGEKVKRK